MLGQKSQLLSAAEYLEGEQQSQVRHEFIGGVVYAMSGGTMAHNRAMQRMAEALSRRRGAHGCEITVADMKVSIPNQSRYYYPDVMLVCEPVADSAIAVENPCLIVEVLSPSTEATDRREKWLAYQSINSLREYILVDPDKAQIELWRRQSLGWKHELLDINDHFLVECLEAWIPVAELYAAPANPPTAA